MGEQRAEQAPEAVLRMVVTRADGTVHDHGIVAATYRNPIKQAWWRLIGKPLADRRIAKSNQEAGTGPGAVPSHLAAACAAFITAAVLAWWATDIHHMPPATFAVNALAALGAFDLAVCLRNIARNLWRHWRRSNRTTGRG